MDGERYFVPFTLPGEVVEAEPVDRRGEGVAAELVEVLSPSRHRETPPCAHFGSVRRLRAAALAADVYAALEGRPDRARPEASAACRARVRAAAARCAGRAAAGRLRAASARASGCWPVSTSGRARGSSMSASASSRGRR
jgi:hypothetical protein